VDYAEAVMGFSFKGRKGTPVIKGVVVAAEYREAVDAVIEALHDEEQDAERNRRSQAALQLWKRFLIALKIVRHVEGYREEWEEEPTAVQEDEGADEDEDEAMQDRVDNDAGHEEGMESEEYIDDGEGGFFR
jgi:xeroderma pigmentosum group C-complementing protein